MWKQCKLLVVYAAVIILYHTQCLQAKNGNRRRGCERGYRFYKGDCLRAVKFSKNKNLNELCGKDVLLDASFINSNLLWPYKKYWIFQKANAQIDDNVPLCIACKDEVIANNAIEYDVVNKCQCGKENENFHPDSFVICRKNTTKEDLPRFRGIPCSRIISGKKIDAFGREIHFDTQHQTSFRNLDKWKQGNYSCRWTYYAWNPTHGTADVNVKLSIIFKYKRPQKLPNETSCHLMFGASGSDGKVLHEDECVDRRTYRTVEVSSKDKEITFHTVINNKYESPISFEIIASSVVTKEPVKYDVSNTATLNDDYTWKMASDFCQNNLPNGNLCRIKDLCRDGNPKVQTTKSKYIPIGDNYNEWISVNKQPVCMQLFYKSPPIWGQEAGHCRNNNCGFKSTVYCCEYEPTDPSPPVMVSVRQETSRLSHGQYAYKFSYFGVRSDEVLDEIPSRNEWYDIGRIEGDLRKFGLNDKYSKLMPDPIYFCYYSNKKTKLEKVYLLSKEECFYSWSSHFALYGSLEQKDGLVPIYVGVSTTGSFYRSRVSMTKPCCGFDDPELSFTIYTKPEHVAVAQLPPYHMCKDEHVLTQDSGIITSPNFPALYPQFADCLWHIKVDKTRRIKFTLSMFDVGFEEPGCRNTEDFVEFTDGSRVLGRLCGHHQQKTFKSPSNYVTVALGTSKNYLYTGFQMKYESVLETLTGPISLNIDDGNAKWEDANKLCKDNELELCKFNEICPLSSDALSRQEYKGRSFTAVQDVYDGWVVSEESGKCTRHDLSVGPPNFRTNVTTDVNEYRDIVYCCGYETFRRFFENDAVGDTLVAIYVTNMVDDYGLPLYRYSQEDDNPWYEVAISEDEFNYYDDYAVSVLINRTWSSAPLLEDFDVFSFSLSKEYVEGTYEKLLYFCSREEPTFGFKIFALREGACPDYWGAEFLMYASGSQNADGSLTKLTASDSIYHGATRISTNDKSCCDYQYSFDFYAPLVLAP